MILVRNIEIFLRAVRFIFFNSSSFGWGGWGDGGMGGGWGMGGWGDGGDGGDGGWGDGGMGGWRDGRCTVARILTLIVDYS